MADTYLTSAEARFAEEDFDTYFTLVDQALNIYTELEMIQESSSIALTEAGKVWSIGNIPYTMIFLERAWAPLSESLITDKSADPLLRVLNSFIEDLFSQKRSSTTGTKDEDERKGSGAKIDCQNHVSMVSFYLSAPRL